MNRLPNVVVSMKALPRFRIKLVCAALFIHNSACEYCYSPRQHNRRTLLRLIRPMSNLKVRCVMILLSPCERSSAESPPRLSKVDMHIKITLAFEPFKQYIEYLAMGKLDGYLDSVHRKDKFTVPGVTMSTDLHLLLHDLGNSTDRERITQLFLPGTTSVILNCTRMTIPNYFSCSQLFETSGAGKTRLLLEGLCHHWGFYIACSTKDKGPVSGSGDFEAAVETLLSISTWDQDESAEGIKMNRDAAKRVFAMLLCARVFTFSQFVRCLPVQTDVKVARRRWVLLQAMPARGILGRDIFVLLFQSLRNADTDTMLDFIQTTLYQLDTQRQDIFPLPEGSRTSYFAIVDEAQEAADHLKEYFRSSTGTDLRPILHELYHILCSLSWVEGIILSGTALSTQVVGDSVGSISARYTGRTVGIRIFTDTGHFQSHEPFQMNYVLRYLPLSDSNSSDVRLRERIRYWFSGRCVIQDLLDPR